MDKVYVLTREDISEGIIIDTLNVYTNHNKAKHVFNNVVKNYLDDNDFTNYDIIKSDNEFIAIHKEEKYNDYVKILLTETNIIK